MTDSSMLKYQYSTMLDQLILLQLHAEDPNCPCSLRGIKKGELGEFCEPKHTRAIVALARETISMESDEARVDYLETLVLEGTELLGKMEKKLCGEEVDFGELVVWARDKRKPLEAMVYEGFCDLALVDEALVKEVAEMFEKDEFDYTLQKDYSPRTGITSVRIDFTAPKGTMPTLYIDLPKDEAEAMAASIADITKRLGYTASKPDKRGEFYLMHNVPTIPTVRMDLADFGFVDRDGNLTSPHEQAIENALREAVIIAGTRERTKFAVGGTLLPKKREEEVIKGCPITRKVTITEVCPSDKSKCSYDLTIKDEFKRKRKDVAVSTEDLATKIKEALTSPDAVRLAGGSRAGGQLALMQVTKMFEKTTCPCKTGIEPEKMSIQAIQDELNALLFDEETWKACDAKDRELLTIVIAQPKAHHFDFLTGKTEWKVRGKWKRPNEGFDIEANVQLDIEFKDAADECVGKRIIELLKAYNTKVVGETLLYARIIPVEEGTLTDVARMFEKAGDKVSTIKSIIDYEIYLGILEYGAASTLSRAKELAKLAMKELDLLWRELLAKSYERGKIIEQSVYIGLGRKVPAYLQESTLSSIGSAAITGVGIGAGFKFIDWLAKKFSEKELGEGEAANPKIFCLSEVDWFNLQNLIAKGQKQEAMELLWSKGIVLNKGEMEQQPKGLEEYKARLLSERDIVEKWLRDYKDKVPLAKYRHEEGHWLGLNAAINLLPDIAFAQKEGEMGIKLGEEAPYARQLPAYVDVFKTTIAKHYRPTEDFHDGSIRVLKPEKDILVYLGCLKSDDWDGERCSPNPTVLKTIVPNTKKYQDELDDLEWTHPEVKINYREKEVGVEPVVSEGGQEELQAVGEALKHAEEVA